MKNTFSNITEDQAEDVFETLNKTTDVVFAGSFKEGHRYCYGSLITAEAKINENGKWDMSVSSNAITSQGHLNDFLPEKLHS